MMLNTTRQVMAALLLTAALLTTLTPSTVSAQTGTPSQPVLTASGSTLSWTIPDNGVEVRGVNIYNVGANPEYVTSVGWPTSTWTAGQLTGEFYVIAYDNGGANVSFSQRSNRVSVATARSDVPAPTGLRADRYGNSNADLFWDRVTTQTLSYNVRVNGGTPRTTNGNSLYLDGLTTGPVNVEVQAINTAGDTSAYIPFTIPAFGTNPEPEPGDGPFASVRNTNDSFELFSGLDHDAAQPSPTDNRLTDVSVGDTNDSNDNSANFRVSCQYSHLSYDDPIINPDTPGRPHTDTDPGSGHLHLFFGKTNTDAYTNANPDSDDFVADTGGGTCNGFALNRSAYWMPAVVDADDNAIVPYQILVYYKTNRIESNGEVHDFTDVVEMPQGLQLVAGNTSHAYGNYVGDTLDNRPSRFEDELTFWSCGPNGDSRKDETKQQTIPTNCRADEPINATVYFPQCWDGEHLTPYEVDDEIVSHVKQVHVGEMCPEGYESRLPQLGILMYFAPQSTAGWRLSSDRRHDGSMAPAGTTLHADWFGGWNETIMTNWIQNCIHSQHNCTLGEMGQGSPHDLARLDQAGFQSDDYGRISTTDFGDLNRYKVPIDQVPITAIRPSTRAGTPPPATSTPEQDRVAAVDEAVAALESYGAERGTLKVVGGGSRGAGQGWFNYQRGANYPQSVATTLVETGHLAAGAAQGPDWISDQRITDDFLVYRCKDRIGVFSPSSTTPALSTDSTWWDSNGCNRFPIDTKGSTYFKVSEPITAAMIETVRQRAVTEMVAALEAYGDANGTYRVTGGGFRGRGVGWVHYQKPDTNYTTSIASQLEASGHLVGDTFVKDPIWLRESATRGDQLIYLCGDRAGVFTRSGNGEPSTADLGWWNDNNCPTGPLDKAKYFALTDPL